jgi:hypothetical protein
MRLTGKLGKLASSEKFKKKVATLLPAPKGKTIKDCIEAVKHLDFLRKTDQVQSAQLGGYMRDEMQEQMYAGYLTSATIIIDTFRTELQAHQYLQIDRQLNDVGFECLYKCLSFVVRNKCTETIQQRYEYTMIENVIKDLVQSPWIRPARRRKLMRLMLYVAQTEEEREWYQDLITQVETHQARDKYHIDTDAQNVHSTILNTLFRRKLILLAQKYQPEDVVFFEEVRRCVLDFSIAAAQKRHLEKKKAERVEQKQHSSPSLPPSRHEEQQTSCWETFKNTVQSVWMYFCSVCLPGDPDQPIVVLHHTNVYTYDEDYQTYQTVDVDYLVPATLTPIRETGDEDEEEQEEKEEVIDVQSLTISKVLDTIETSPIEFSPTKLTLKDVLCIVFTLVQTLKPSDIREEAMERLVQELNDCYGYCSSGYCTRLLNVLCGYSDIDVEVVEFYADRMMEEFKRMFESESEGNEELIDSYISFGQERQLFETYCQNRVREWKQKLQTKFVSHDKTHSLFLFEEDFKEAYRKFTGTTSNSE